MRNFGPKNVIPTVEGPDTLRKMSSSPMEGKKVGQKHRHFWKFCVITYEGAESSDTFREKGEYTLRGVKVVKKVKKFPAVLQKTSYVASRRH